MTNKRIDYNKFFSPGDINGGMVNAVIEVPLGTTEKYEWNLKNLKMEIDRLEPTAFPEPVNYGFIPQTIGEDGDALDVFVISDVPVPTGTVLYVKIIGVMRFIDEGFRDDKIVTVTEDSKYQKISDIPKSRINKITHHFSHYKDDSDFNQTTVGDWLDQKNAISIILESINRWKKTQQ